MDSRLARLWVLRRSRRLILTGGAAALVAAAAGGWWLRDWLVPLDPAERLIELPAGDSVEMTGFSIHRELTERAIREFPGGAVTAMRYLSPDQGQVHRTLTLRQKEWAFRRGWKAWALCRPESGFAALGVESGHFAPRFDAGFRLAGDDIELIATKQIQAGWDGIRAAASLPPAPNLLRLEMVYDPVRAAATVSVDGRILIRDYTGHTEYRDDLGVYFGLGSVTGAMASAIFGGLHFEIFA
jgi:hypothetical protein